MSYEPSHREPPRQERWPNATPGEGWPAYRQDEGGRAWESAAAYAGSRNGYADNGYAANGRVANGYAANGYAANGYGDAWGGAARYADAGYRYGGTTTAYPTAEDGYADGFGGAADGYAQDYDHTTWEQAYEEAGTGWDGYADGYAQPGHEFTGTAGYPVQDTYPALDSDSSVLVAPDTMGEWWRDQGADGEPGHRGAVVGAMMGVLAAAVALGVATFAAAFVRPQAAPVSVVGAVLFDRVPAALKSAVTAHFGAHGKTVLLLGAIGLIAVVVGWMARRSPSIGVAGIATFGILGAFIIVTRPQSRASDVIPSAIGGLAGIVALLWLARASAPVRPAYSGRGRRRAR
jgi:hypothetical protein